MSAGPSDPTLETAPRKRFFYGWWIVMAGAVGSGLHGTFYFIGAGTFFLPIAETFGTSKTALSGAFSLARLESGLLGPLGGWLIERLGARRLMFIGVTLMGGGFMALSAVPSLLWFYVVFVCMIALGSAWSFGPPVHATVVNWFIRRRTRAIAIVTSGNGLAGVTVPVLAWGIAHYGWRDAAFVAGVLIIVVGFPIAAAMRFRPEPYGYAPDGVVDSRPDGASSGAPETGEIDFTTREALRSSAFWVMGLSFLMRMTTSAAIPIHLVAYLHEDVGFSTPKAALFLGLIGPVAIAGRAVFGAVGDIVPKRYSLFASLALQGASMPVLATVSSTTGAVVFLILFSVAHGGSAIMMLSARAEFFGRRSYATIAGFMSSIILVGAISGPIIAGLSRDHLDSYAPAFYLFGGVAGVAALALLFLKRPVPARLRGG